MRHSADEECNPRRHRSAQFHTARSDVNVPPEEVVDGDIPLATEFQPVQRVPPVGVELAVRELGDFGEGAEDVLEDYEEDEQEDDHEGEEQAGDCLREDQAAVDPGGGAFEADPRFVEDGDDEFFRRYCHQEDAAEDCEGFVEEFEVASARCAWVLQFVAEGWTEEVVNEIGDGEVLWVGDGALWRGELFCEVVPQLHYWGDVHRFVIVVGLRFCSAIYFHVPKLECSWVTNSCCCWGRWPNRHVQLFQSVERRR